MSKCHANESEVLACCGWWDEVSSGGGGGIDRGTWKGWRLMREEGQGREERRGRAEGEQRQGQIGRVSLPWTVAGLTLSLSLSPSPPPTLPSPLPSTLRAVTHQENKPILSHFPHFLLSSLQCCCASASDSTLYEVQNNKVIFILTKDLTR